MKTSILSLLPAAALVLATAAPAALAYHTDHTIDVHVDGGGLTTQSAVSSNTSIDLTPGAIDLILLNDVPMNVVVSGSGDSYLERVATTLSTRVASLVTGQVGTGTAGATDTISGGNTLHVTMEPGELNLSGTTVSNDSPWAHLTSDVLIENGATGTLSPADATTNGTVQTTGSVDSGAVTTQGGAAVGVIPQGLPDTGKAAS